MNYNVNDENNFDNSTVKNYYNVDYYEFRNVVSRAVPIETHDYPDIPTSIVNLPMFKTNNH